MTEAEMKPNKWKKVAFSTIAGAFAGFFGAMAVMRSYKAGYFGDLAEIDMIALLVAMLYLLMALVVGLGAASPGFGARILNVEDREELMEMRDSLLASGIAMACLGLILTLIVLAGPGGILAPAIAGWASLVLLGVTVVFAWRSSKHSDELMREVSRECAALSYYAIAIGLGGWVAAAHLGFVAGPSPIAVLVILWTVVLAATFVAAGRKGMLAPR